MRACVCCITACGVTAWVRVGAASRASEVASTLAVSAYLASVWLSQLRSQSPRVRACGCVSHALQRVGPHQPRGRHGHEVGGPMQLYCLCVSRQWHVGFTLAALSAGSLSTVLAVAALSTPRVLCFGTVVAMQGFVGSGRGDGDG